MSSSKIRRSAGINMLTAAFNAGIEQRAISECYTPKILEPYKFQIGNLPAVAQFRERGMETHFVILVSPNSENLDIQEMYSSYNFNSRFEYAEACVKAYYNRYHEVYHGKLTVFQSYLNGRDKALLSLACAHDDLAGYANSIMWKYGFAPHLRTW